MCAQIAIVFMLISMERPLGSSILINIKGISCRLWCWCKT